jgi:hypothetical protein
MCAGKDEQAAMSDDWTLTPRQYVWMTTHEPYIRWAFEADDMPGLREFAQTADYLQAFGKMSFDEAYDRFECMQEGNQ